MPVNEKTNTQSGADMSGADLYDRYLSTALGPYRNKAEWVTASERYFTRIVARHLPMQQDATILDLACGPGRYLQAMHKLGYTNAFGIDISEEQVEYAKQRLSITNLAKADMFMWLVEHPSRYDCILALDILEHMALGDLLRLAKLIAGALKPGGRLVVQVPSGTSPMNPVIYGDLTHVRAFTPESMRQLFRHAGLIAREVSEIPPIVHNIRSAWRRAAWMVIRPLIQLVAMSLHGSAASGATYTSNFICVAEKPVAPKRAIGSE